MSDGAVEEYFGSKPLQPPHSIDAEQAVIGALMLDNRSILSTMEAITSEDFYSQDHRIIFRAITALTADKQPADFITVSEWLKARKLLEEAGGVAYLARLATDTPSAANVRGYVGIVRRMAFYRKMICIGSDMSQDGYQARDEAPESMLARHEAALAGARETGLRSQVQARSYAELLPIVENKIDDAIKNGPRTGLLTGIRGLDKLTTGMHPGDFIVVGGRPGTGKSTLTLGIAEHVAMKQKKGVAIYSMEMPGDRLMMRSLASVCRIDHQKLRGGQLNDHDMSRFMRGRAELAAAPIFVDDTPALSPISLRARALRVRQSCDLGLVIVDYMQLMQVSGAQNDTARVSEISRSLKALALELGVPVIGISSLSRSLEARENKRPRMSDLRESGQIEFDADLILFVYRDEVYNHGSPDTGTVELIIGKQRDGELGMVRAAFVGQYCAIDNLAAEVAYANSPPPAYLQ